MSDELKIRRVRPSDKEEVLSLTSDIWKGHDYIPEYFDKWIEEGGFICGVIEDDIVGLAKHTWHTEDILWLEGLRVDPLYHEKGYGRAMIEGQMRYIDDLDYKIARFLTSDRNKAVQKVVGDLGFDLKQRYENAGLYDDDLEDIELPQEHEVKDVEVEYNSDEVIDFIMNSPAVEKNAGLYIQHWTGYPLDEKLLEERIQDGCCYSIREDGLDSIMFLHGHEVYDSLNVGLAWGSLKGLEILFKFGLRKCLLGRYERFRVKTGSELVIKASKEVGLRQREEHKYSLVYEYRRD